MIIKIEPFTHSCIIPEGDMAGNTHVHEVSSWDITSQNRCAYCDEFLAPLNEVVAHIYEELTT